MKIVVGLGNPGEKYCRNRHNIGFMAIDAIAAMVDSQQSKVNKKLKAEVWVFREFGEFREQVILVKPLTFMNMSGEAVKKIIKWRVESGELKKGTGEKLFVVHDELDLALGRLKIQKNISAAGHKGIQSIIDHIGTQDFVRFRVGVGRGDEDYLLSNFTKDEMKVIEPAIEKTAKAVLFAVEHGVEKAMRKFN